MSDNINYINLKLLECQVDIVLRALELYAYNCHYTFSVNDSDYLNTMIYHTYEGILANYSRNKYVIGYNVLHNCSLRSSRIKKYNYYKKKCA